jgi:hypothetical protein
VTAAVDAPEASVVCRARLAAVESLLLADAYSRCPWRRSEQILAEASARESLIVAAGLTGEPLADLRAEALGFVEALNRFEDDPERMAGVWANSAEALFGPAWRP